MNDEDKVKKAAELMQNAVQKMDREQVEKALSKHLDNIASLIAQAVLQRRLDIAVEVATNLLADMLVSKLLTEITQDTDPVEFIDKAASRLIELVYDRIHLYIETTKYLQKKQTQGETKEEGNKNQTDNPVTPFPSKSIH